MLAYDGDEVVGWAAVAPRAELPFARSTQDPARRRPAGVVGVVRPGARRATAAAASLTALLDGAVDVRRVTTGAPAVEGYPVDNRGEKVDLTMAYVGTRALFEAGGFTLASETDAVSGGFPRVIMRRTLPDGQVPQ